MSDPYPLSNLGRQIKAHWRKYRPKMYRALEKAGKLDESVYAAQELTGNTLADLVQKGMDWNQAWELIREEWAFLPSEEDEEERRHPPDPVILIEQFEQRRDAERAATSARPVPEEGADAQSRSLRVSAAKTDQGTHEGPKEPRSGDTWRVGILLGVLGVLWGVLVVVSLIWQIARTPLGRFIDLALYFAGAVAIWMVGYRLALASAFFRWGVVRLLLAVFIAPFPFFAGALLMEELAEWGFGQPFRDTALWPALRVTVDVWPHAVITLMVLTWATIYAELPHKDRPGYWLATALVCVVVAGWLAVGDGAP